MTARSWSFIVKHCEFFEIERSKLKDFIKDIAEDFSGNPNEEISPKSLNPIRIKYQEKARQFFNNEMASTFVEMLVDAIVITIVCNAMIKRNIWQLATANRGAVHDLIGEVRTNRHLNPFPLSWIQFYK